MLKQNKRQFAIIIFNIVWIIVFPSTCFPLQKQGATIKKPIIADIEYPIVYVRCSRTEENVTISGNISINGKKQLIEKTLVGSDIYDVLPEVSRFYGDFNAPCDLILLNPDKTEKVLYNCSSKSNDKSSCAALDPAVSFDGKTIAFSVFRGKIYRNKHRFRARDLNTNADKLLEVLDHVELPNKLLSTFEAQLHLVDVDTGKITALPHKQKDFDSGPAWLSNGRIAFTSQRSGTFVTAVPNSTPQVPGPPVVSQIYTMDVDGRNVELASYHGLSGEQHPFQLKDGRVVYSSWQLFGALPFRTLSAGPGFFGTLANFFHLYTQNPDGSNAFALYGQHLLEGGKKRWPTHTAAHFMTQSSDERIWVTEYYRARNKGIGTIVGFPLPPEGQEGHGPNGKNVGIGDLYRPKGFSVLASWASNEDFFSKKMLPPDYLHPSYKDPIYYTGKLGHPSAGPRNSLLVTWGKGGCSMGINKELDPMTEMTNLGIDNPGCDTGIYLYPAIPKRESRHPLDMQMVIDSREWHEFMARPVIPYQAIYGIDAPFDIPEPQHRAEPHKDLPPGSPFGILSASSIILRETHPLEGISFEGEQQWGLQGTDTIDYSDNELCGVRILGVQPNLKIEHKKLHNLTGERVFILGEFPVRNYASDGSPIMDKNGMHDTSFRVKFPAHMPYLMQAIDCSGRTLNTDQTWQHLRPMEQKTCGGCHVHSKEGLAFETTYAAKKEYPVYKLGEGLVPILEEGKNGNPRIKALNKNVLQLEFEKDIMPIFKRHCVECHGSKKAAKSLRLDLSGIDKKSTWYCLAMDRHQNCIDEQNRHKGSHKRGILRRPQLSKYLRFMNARGSLLYWKALNKRTDNRNDNQFTEKDGIYHDVDFGPNHPSSITKEELGILSRWIDIGAPAGENTLKDTIAPTITIMGKVKGKLITHLLIGAVDVPSGINRNSLKACLTVNARCDKNINIPKRNNNILELPMTPPLSDKRTIIRVSVSDKAGNIAKKEITVGRIIKISQPFSNHISQTE